MGTQRDIDAFHAHLDQCSRCESRPLDLCPTGKILIERTAPAPKMDWERTPEGPIGDIVRELTEFKRFSEAHRNAKLHVKRWNKTLRNYDCGHVFVVDGKVQPTIHSDIGTFKFENVTELVIAGWIGD